MSTLTVPPPATLDDLMRVEGRAELIAGRIVHLMASGVTPSIVALRIVVRLIAHADARGGLVPGNDCGYAVDHLNLASGRQSFCPDASYYLGPPLANPMGFIPGAPTFAVEVRSENDYGPKPDREYAAKRADYFAAGTLVVWDVDPLARTVRSYRADGTITEFAAADTADAEPALPGWRVPVAELFPSVQA